MSTPFLQLIEKSNAADWLVAGTRYIRDINPFLNTSVRPERTSENLNAAGGIRADSSGNYRLIELSLENLWFCQFLIEEITAAVKGSPEKSHQGLEFQLVHVVAESECLVSLVLEVLVSFRDVVNSHLPVVERSVDSLYLCSSELLSESQKLLNAAANSGALGGELMPYFSALGRIHELNRDFLSLEGGSQLVCQRIAKELGLESGKPQK